MRVLQLVIGIAILAIFGCSKDVEEDLFPDTSCETEDMSYTNDILPIISSNCYQCHDAANNFGGITLEGYSDLKIYADNGELVGSIKHESGFSFMPQGAPQLLPCEIEKVESWIAQGTKDN